jgi:hypothetical protein
VHLISIFDNRRRPKNFWPILQIKLISPGCLLGLINLDLQLSYLVLTHHLFEPERLGYLSTGWSPVDFRMHKKCQTESLRQWAGKVKSQAFSLSCRKR